MERWQYAVLQKQQQQLVELLLLLLLGGGISCSSSCWRTWCSVAAVSSGIAPPVAMCACL
jgi:hypothetical protein